MEQFLPRGYALSSSSRIKRMIASDNDWQIYLTNSDSHVLAVKQELYSLWVSEFVLPPEVFHDSADHRYKVLESSGDYIIASLLDGPYPNNYGQIEAFSIAFKTARDLFPKANFDNSIYIEEYSFILPTNIEQQSTDDSVIFGHWITGGINLSVEQSYARVKKIMSWLPQNYLYRSATLAGFSVPEEIEEEKGDALSKDTELIDERPDTIPSGERFVLVGRPDLEQFFNDNIIDIVLHQEQYKRMGISFPGATILYGPPGCGKTYAVERLSEYLGWKRFDIDSTSIASSYIHDTSKKISDVFNAAIQAAPSILVIDEMEAFLSDRGMAGPSGTHHVEEVAEFLRRIPEAISKGVLVFAMTNMIDSIDPAIRRRGRFDHVIEVKMATAEEIEALLLARFKELPVDDSVDAKAVANQLAEHPLSDVSFVLREAGRFAVKNNLENIDKKCFDDALNMLPKAKKQSKIGF